MNNTAILEQLIWLSHELGREERQLAILGEGNTERAVCGWYLLGQGVGEPTWQHHCPGL